MGRLLEDLQKPILGHFSLPKQWERNPFRKRFINPVHLCEAGEKQKGMSLGDVENFFNFTQGARKIVR